MSNVILGGDRDDDGPQPYRVIVPSIEVDRLLYLPDGRLVSGDTVDGTVTFWNVEEEKQESTLLHDKDEMWDLALTGDGKRIISSDKKGRVKVLDVELDKVVKEWLHPEVPALVSVSPDNRLVAVGSKKIFIHAIEGWEVQQTIEVGDHPRCMSFSPAGNKLACSTKFDIHVYDVDSGALILGPLTRHRDKIRAVLWSRDGRRLFSGSYDKTIRCWNANTGIQIGYSWTGHNEGITSLSLSPDGSILASGSLDDTIRFWNATTGDPIGQPLRHRSLVWNICFSPSGEFVASIASNEIYVWQVPKLDTVCRSIHFAVFALISSRHIQTRSTLAIHVTRSHSHLHIPHNLPVPNDC